MNYMPEVAKMLSVELGEEFEIVFPSNCCCHATAMLTNEGAKVINSDVYDIYNFKSYLLTHLLNGAYSIRRKPWKPKLHDVFWYVDAYGRVNYQQWNMRDCINFYKIGNCYRTAQEANSNCDKWITFYTSDEVLEV